MSHIVLPRRPRGASVSFHGGLVIDVERLGATVGMTFPATMLDLIDLGPDALAALGRALKETDGKRAPGIAVHIENVRLLAPIPRPRKNIFGIGLNYVEHVAESARTLDTSKDLPTKPVVFSKPPTSVIADGEPIQHNAAMTQQLDWEVELAVIIGKKSDTDSPGRRDEPRLRLFRHQRRVRPR